MSEKDLMHEIQVACCRDPDVRLWRNNNGQGWVGIDQSTPTDRSRGVVVLHRARIIRFGLGEGTGDLIGARSLLITPEMVGRRVMVFANVEVKDKRGRPTPEQLRFIEVVKSLGGFGGIARTVDEAREVLTRT